MFNIEKPVTRIKYLRAENVNQDSDGTLFIDGFLISFSN